MNYYEFKVAWCDFCRQGWVEIVKEKSTDNLILQCSECLGSWESMEKYNKDSIANKKSEDEYLAERHYEEYDEEDDNDEFLTIKPDYQEIKKKGWEKYIIEG